METLILNGSPRQNGDTASLVGELKGFLRGDVTEIRAYSCGIAPCTDCRYCWEHPGCAKRDAWALVDEKLRACDSVVIASPIYFSQLTGPLLSVLSRLQQYYCARRFRGEKRAFPEKRGGVILAGGGDGSPKPAAEMAAVLLRQMNCRELAPPICCCRTNSTPALEEPGIRERLRGLADFLEGPRQGPPKEENY